MNDLMILLPNSTAQELDYVKHMTQDFNEEEVKRFAMLYRGRRKDETMMLILILLGLVSVAGIHRFVMGEIPMGLLYLFTGGLCLVGTILDAIKHKEITLQYNQKQVDEVWQMICG